MPKVEEVLIVIPATTFGLGLLGHAGKWVVRKIVDDRDATIARLRRERDELQKENRVLRDKLFDIANASNPVLAEAIEIIKEYQDVLSEEA